MSRPELVVIARFVLAALVAVVPLAAASCASEEAGGNAPPSPSDVLPDPNADGGTDALADGACDASDPGCVEQALSCNEASWCPLATGTSGLYVLTKVWGSAKDDVWAIGSGGTVIHWNGSAWAPSPLPSDPLPIRNTFFSIWGAGPNDVWIASSTKTIYRNTGAGWINQPSPIDTSTEIPIYAIWGDGAGRLRFGTGQFYVLDDNLKGLLGTQLTAEADGDGGITWTPHAGSATVKGYTGTADDLWLIADNFQYTGWQYALTQHGTSSSADAGDDALVFTDVECHSVARLHGIWGSSTNEVWAVGDSGVIRRIHAGQAEWEIVPSVTKENLYAVWGTSASDVWAAGDNGTILHYDGTAWSPDTAAFAIGQRKPTLTGIWGSGPDDVWIVGGNVALHYTGKKLEGDQ